MREGPHAAPELPAIVEAEGDVWEREWCGCHISHGCCEVIVELCASLVAADRCDCCTELLEDCISEFWEVGMLTVAEDVVERVILIAEGTFRNCEVFVVGCVAVDGFCLISSMPALVE